MKVHTDIDSIKGISRPILTIGTFDGVHRGHRVIIDRLNGIAQEEQGESVLLTFHPHPRSVVSEVGAIELLTTMEERLQLLEAAGLDHVIVYPFTHEFSRISALAYVRDILVNRIDLHYAVVGYDHHFGRNREGDIHLLHELAEVYGFQVEEISAQTIEEVKVSSTKVRSALREGRLDDVKKYLGYDYMLTGTVVKGDGRGKGMGFPTANILPNDPNKLIPAQGVYAIKALIEDQVRTGMMNIGTRPTFSSGQDEVHIEAHLFDLDTDLYGKEMRIDFLARIRGEKRFSGKEELQDQLQQDKAEVLGLLKDH
ncbi:MAG: bifunctional riboflavin kinase/FAD synthetase [Flavobacteriales bacterium]|nr:bifunctional riboflavin kinase/FAD synthetase [Flavobacteriales bacterium]